MALENLTPVTRKEAILDGADITPVTREEYFWQQAATNGFELPAVTDADNGDVLTVVDGAWDKAAPASDLPLFTDGDSGKVLGLTGSPLAPAWTTPSGGNLLVTALDDNDVITFIGGKVMTLLAACTDSAVHYLAPSGTVGNSTEAVYNAVKAAYDNNGAVMYQVTLGDTVLYAPSSCYVDNTGAYHIVLPIGSYQGSYNIVLKITADSDGNGGYTLLVGGYASAMTTV